MFSDKLISIVIEKLYGEKLIEYKNNLIEELYKARYKYQEVYDIEYSEYLKETDECLKKPYNYSMLNYPRKPINQLGLYDSMVEVINNENFMNIDLGIGIPCLDKNVILVHNKIKELIIEETAKEIVKFISK